MDSLTVYALLKKDIDAIKPLSHKMFGFKRNRNDSNPNTRITYVGENVNYEPFAYDFANGTYDVGGWGAFIEALCAPVMLKYDGTIAYELNRNDTTKKKDGTASDIANSAFAGNAMVQFRKFRYVSRKTVGDYDYVYFSDTKVDDSFKDYAFIGEDGELKEAFYYSMFEGSYSDEKLRSIADVAPMVSQNAATEMARAKANGSGWNIGAWSQLNYIWDILTMISKSDNLQNSFGRGICGASSAGTTGGSKAKGAFFGSSDSTTCVRTLYIEDLWGRIWDRYNGLVNDNGTFKVKMTPSYPTPTDSSSTYADYLAVGTTPGEGYVKNALCGDNGFIPTTTGGSDSTYFCDYFYKNDSGVKFALVGGNWSDGSRCGRYVSVGIACSIANSDIGARLLKV